MTGGVVLGTGIAFPPTYIYCWPPAVNVSVKDPNILSLLELLEPLPTKLPNKLDRSLLMVSSTKPSKC